jgi:hypothetical protein
VRMVRSNRSGMERSEWSGVPEPEPGCLHWGNLTKEWWRGAGNSWARNQLASHNEELVRLLLFSGSVIVEQDGGGERTAMAEESV